MKKLNVRESQLVLKLAKQLQQDILQRYHNSEYWDYDIVETFKQNEQLEDKEVVKLYEILIKYIN